MQIRIQTDRGLRAAVARRRSGLPAHEFAPLLGVNLATPFLSWGPLIADAAGGPVVGAHARGAAVVELVPVADSASLAGAGHAVEGSLTVRSGRILRFPFHLGDERQ